MIRQEGLALHAKSLMTAAAVALFLLIAWLWNTTPDGKAVLILGLFGVLALSGVGLLLTALGAPKGGAYLGGFGLLLAYGAALAWVLTCWILRAH